MRPLFRFFSMLGLFVIFFIEGIVVELTCFVLATSERTRNRIKAELVSRYAIRGLYFLSINLDSNLPAKPIKGLMVSNHISYIDVLVLAAIQPSLFITSVEVKNSLGLGWIVKVAGCLFVERRSRAFLGAETKEIRKAIWGGTPVVLFPEGTTSEGKDILTCRPALFQSAIDTG